VALKRAHHGAGRRGGRALLLGPARLGQLRLAAALAALALGAVGCASQIGAADTSAPGAGQGEARVTAITDGDTITLSGIGRTRLIGVDTPEVYGHAECYGQAASAFTKRVLKPGRVVKVRIGRESHDRYGRTLAYVWLKDGTFFNELLAERGYATPLTIPPNDDYAKRFVRAARRAREASRGLWGNTSCAQQNKAPPKRGCARFATHAEAQRWWESSGRPAGYDGDGDGQVCEDLP
jgi:micrococcal nuclease